MNRKGRESSNADTGPSGLCIALGDRMAMVELQKGKKECTHASEVSS